MTGYRPFGQVAVRCPRCGREARFDGDPYRFVLRSRATAVEIEAGHPYGGWIALERYPHLVPWDPKQVQADLRRPEKHGVITCRDCGLTSAATCRFPHDAWYQWDLRGLRLYARDRAHAIALRDYIADPARRGKWAHRFHKLPRVVIAAKNRDLVVRRIERSLGLLSGHRGRSGG